MNYQEQLAEGRKLFAEIVEPLNAVMGNSFTNRKEDEPDYRTEAAYNEICIALYLLKHILESPTRRLGCV